jgi:hypothetical protein
MRVIEDESLVTGISEDSEEVTYDSRRLHAATLYGEGERVCLEGGDRLRFAAPN